MFRRLVSAALFPVIWSVRVLDNRHVLATLGEMDDRGLADIGLSRQDLRDVTALPLGSDPTRVLAGRAHEREARERRARKTTIRLPIAAE